LYYFVQEYKGEKDMAFFNRNKNGSNCPCKNSIECELKLKCMRLTLHSRYICGIAIGIVIWTLATGKANSPEFSSWISFASTVASIILSVLAIIMSITGEAKTEAMRNQMEDATRRLDEAVENITSANENIKCSIVDLQGKIDSMSEKVDNFSKENKEPDLTVEKDLPGNYEFN
jgi:hypothetical protein